MAFNELDIYQIHGMNIYDLLFETRGKSQRGQEVTNGPLQSSARFSAMRSQLHPEFQTSTDVLLSFSHSPCQPTSHLALSRYICH